MPRFTLCVPLALLLCGCGGDGDDGPVASQSVTAPVSSALFVTAATDEAIVAAGRDVQITLTKIGTAPATSRIRQISGTPLGALSLSGSQLSFHAPELTVAGTAELQITSTGADGHEYDSLVRVLVSPSSGTGRLLTLIGSPDSQGLHWIIAGDGFTADQQDDLRRAALEMGRALLRTPELAAHAGIWNVHVLGAVSRGSGVDSAGSLVDTVFDGALACTGVARVACVDWHKVQSAVLAEHAPRAWLAVVLNSREYVGTSGPNGLIISRHAAAGALALHEMGHQVAGLADEYVDEVTAQQLVPRYVEGTYPNVTTRNDLALAPWRHWLEDPQADVGLHEGAFYSASGFYRPKADSLMRTLAAPLGEVNGEAWLRAQYRRAPPVSAVSPEATQVRALAGDPVDFEIVSQWPRPLVEVRWFVDDIEAIDARDQSRFRYTADGQRHGVRVEAADVSGRIRAPTATEARYSRTWTVSPEAPVEKARPSLPLTTDWLQMRVDHTGHSIQARVSTKAMNLPGVRGNGDWRYELLDAAGDVIAQGQLDDPRFVRGPMALPGESQTNHEPAILPVGHYLIGVPAEAPARRLRISPMAANREKLDSGSLPGVVEILLDSP